MSIIKYFYVLLFAVPITTFFFLINTTCVVFDVEKILRGYT
jgi:hypothetical protein